MSYRILRVLLSYEITLKSGIIGTKSILRSSVAISHMECRNSRLIMTKKSCKQLYKVFVSMSNRSYRVKINCKVPPKDYTLHDTEWYIQDMAPKAVHWYLDLIWSLSAVAPVHKIPWQVADSSDNSAQLYSQLMPPLLGCKHLNFSSNQVQCRSVWIIAYALGSQ